MQSRLSPENITVRWARADEIGALCDLFAISYASSEGFEELSERYLQIWRWKFTENPDWPNGHPPIIVCEADGRLIGQRPTMPFVLQTPGHALEAGWAVDFCVARDVRNMGVGRQLLSAWLERECVYAALGSNPPAIYLYRKMGLLEVRGVRNMLCVCRPVLSQLRAAGSRRRLYLAAVSVHKACRRPAASGEVVVEEVSDLLHDLADFLRPAQRSFAFVARRTMATLRWRYLDAPHHRYRLAVARGHTGVRGYAVFRTGREYGGLPGGRIVDIMARSNDAEAWSSLVAFVLERLRADRVCVVRCRASAPGLLEALGRHGFAAQRTSPSFFVSGQVLGTGGEDVRDARNWHVTYGDSDAEAVL